MSDSNVAVAPVAARPFERSRARARRHLIAQTITYVVVGLLTLLVLSPLLWLLASSLREPAYLIKYPPQFFPDPITLENYFTVFTWSPFGLFLFNSGKIAVLATLGQLVTCSLAAFTFARLKFPGRTVLFVFFLATLMIPRQLTIIPTYLLMRELGWLNTHTALIVPAWAGGAFGIFLLRQFFLTMPSELMDAAKIDGCNPFDVYRLIALPLARPALATLAVFMFLHYWNDLFYPLIFLTKEQLMTVPIGILAMQGIGAISGGASQGWSAMTASAVMAILPTLVVYILAQRYFVQGIATTGLKG